MTPDQLRKARLRLGLTQAALAIEVGVSWRSIARWEAGDAPIPKPVEKLVQLMEKMR